jgi:hypothetical protein
LRIAIHNHYAGEEVAEAEFSRRIFRAASSLGWEAAEVGSSAEIKRFSPDFVIALHFRTPKLTPYATYGWISSPPVFYANDDHFVKNILSYDGYLSASDFITSWLKDILCRTGKQYFIAPFCTSCHDIPYRPPRLQQPRLVYAGTNWDGPRYQELFEQLDAQPWVDIYGPKNAWRHLKRSYRGVLPFDGVSMLDALNRAGVGLCLHRKEHCETATPSSRIFEIAASGAIAICQEHPFIRQAFGDSVLYFEFTDDLLGAVAQISEHIRWISAHQDESQRLSQKAYDIFSENYTLEKLLSNLIPHHQELVARKGFESNPSAKTPSQQSVQLIVRVGDRDAVFVQRALDSILSQTYQHVGAVIVQYKELPGFGELLNKYSAQLPIEVVRSSCTGFRSTQLWDGLKAVSSEYFGILDDDDVIHPNHVKLLVQLLERSEDRGVAYSGAIRVWERDPEGSSESNVSTPAEEAAELAYFEPFDPNRLVALQNFITSNSFIARTALLTDLSNDPHMPVLEDLFLLLHFCQRTRFVFSYEATSEFYWRGSKGGNVTWQNNRDWSSSLERMKVIFWKQSFPATQTLVQVPWLERIAALEALVNENQKKLLQLERQLAETTARLNRYLNLPLNNAVRKLRRMLFRLPPPPK